MKKLLCLMIVLMMFSLVVAQTENEETSIEEIERFGTPKKTYPTIGQVSNWQDDPKHPGWKTGSSGGDTFNLPSDMVGNPALANTKLSESNTKPINEQKASSPGDKNGGIKGDGTKPSKTGEGTTSGGDGTNSWVKDDKTGLYTYYSQPADVNGDGEIKGKERQSTTWDQDGVQSGHTVTDADGNTVVTNEDWDCIKNCDNKNTDAYKFANKRDYEDTLGDWQRGTSWSKFSTLFDSNEAFAEWSQQVDKILYDAFFLTQDTFVQKVCNDKVNVDSDDSILWTVNDDGLIVPSASITVTKQTITAPNGTLYLYMATYFLRNPTGAPEPKYKNRGSGLISRGKGGLTKDGISTDESRIANAIIRDTQSISNSNARSSRNQHTSEDITWNIRFEGDRVGYLYSADLTTESGDETLIVGDSSVAVYSPNNYFRACMVFTDGELIDATYENRDEICTNIVDSGSSNRIIIPQNHNANI